MSILYKYLFKTDVLMFKSGEIIMVAGQGTCDVSPEYELHHEKTRFLQMRKQRRRSAVQLLQYLHS